MTFKNLRYGLSSSVVWLPHCSAYPLMRQLTALG